VQPDYKTRYPGHYAWVDKQIKKTNISSAIKNTSTKDARGDST
jgi:hypothetical protein